MNPKSSVSTHHLCQPVCSCWKGAPVHEGNFLFIFVLFLANVRDELEDLTDQVNDPMEYEFLEYEASSDTLEDLSDPTLAALQELNENRNLKKLPELFEAYMSLYSQLSNEREVNIILPGEPTSQELEILENELKAFYYKDTSISLTLKVSVNPAIGAGRIYCFDDYMLDLTTTDFVSSPRLTLYYFNLLITSSLRPVNFKL